MESSPSASLIERFSILVDPRDDRAKRHRLIDIIVIAVCAVIGGADSWVDVEWFGKSKRDWFDRLLELEWHPLARHVRTGLCDGGLQTV